MGERSRDNHLMSHIVELLSALETSRLDAGRLLSGDGEALLQTLPQNPGFQAALENLRFMEEMPGGVLIYDTNGITRHPERTDISVYTIDATAECARLGQAKLFNTILMVKNSIKLLAFLLLAGGIWMRYKDRHSMVTTTLLLSSIVISGVLYEFSTFAYAWYFYLGLFGLVPIFYLTMRQNELRIPKDR